MIQDYKITTFQKTHAMLDDDPSSTLSAAQLKAWWDSSPEEVRVALNNLIDALSATTTGASGAHQVASETINGVTGNTVHAQISSVKSQLTGIVLNQVPDGTITPAKLSAQGAGSGFNADKVDGIDFRVVDGLIEFNDGTEWKSMGNTVLLASTTAREQDATARTASVNNSSMLAFKFVPKGTGEVVVSFEIYGSAGTTSMKFNAASQFRNHTASTVPAAADLVSATIGLDYRLPLGSVVAITSSETANSRELANTTAVGSFVPFTATIKVYEQVPIYFLVANNGVATVQCRNIVMKYDKA